MRRTGTNGLAPNLINGSMLLYMAWLLLPAAQASLHAVTGALAVCVFGVGALLNGSTFYKRWWDWALRALLAVLLPLALFYFLDRGAGNLPGYLAEQGMFWFPLLWCAYARFSGDPLLYRAVKPLFVALMVITTLTTLGWLVEGMLRDGKVYAYSRSLGYGAPGREAYLRELMLRNIGGYDFIYASVLLLPVTFYLALTLRGYRRMGAVLFYALQLAMIGLSQYTYAILFAVAITGMELLALLFRAIFRKLPVGASLACTVPVLAALWLLRAPLVQWAGGVAAGFGFENAAYSLGLLNTLFSGGIVDAGSRLDAYSTALQGLAASPVFGSMFGSVKTLGMHSDLLDLLSGMGLIGSAAFGAGAWLIGRGSNKGITRSPAFAHLALQRVFLLVCLTLGTVFYSREIPLVVCLSTALILRNGDTKQAVL